MSINKSKAIEEIETLLNALSKYTEDVCFDAEHGLEFCAEDDHTGKAYYVGKIAGVADILHIIDCHFRNDIESMLLVLKEENV